MQSAHTDFPYTRQNFALRKKLDPLLPTRITSYEQTGSSFGTAWIPEDIPTRNVQRLSDLGTVRVIDGSLPTEVAYVDFLFDVRRSYCPTDALESPNGVQIFEVSSGSGTDSTVIAELTSIGMESRVARRTLDALIEGGKEERFEDGMDSNLSLGLRVLFDHYGTHFANILETRLSDPNIPARVLAEILHTVGSIDHGATGDQRLATLIRFLKAQSPLVRDAAAVGLSYLHDKRAISYLREAIEREPNNGLREDLRAIVEEMSP